MSWKQIEAAFVKAFSAFSMCFTALFFCYYFSSTDLNLGLAVALSIGFSVGAFWKVAISLMGPHPERQEPNG